VATITKTFLVDDIDGSTECIETVEFNADGTTYQIDLSAANGARLRDKLARFIDAAHPVKAPKAAAPAKRGAKTAAVASNKEHVAEIRRWAEQAGLKISSRGRLSAEVVEKYNAEH